MPSKNGNLKSLIQEYLLDEGILRQKISDSKVDFGFIFTFPPGPRSQQMSVFKPKDKNFLNIVVRIQLSKQHANKLTSLKNNKGFQFFNDLKKYFLIKEVYFKIDAQNFMYEIIEQIFPDKDGHVAKNVFFKTIQKVFYCFLYSNLLLDEYCSGKTGASSKLGSKFDFSLYS
ncbi:MAG: DUF2299 domain-containing protein [Promethearchaeota archaeon]|nr:MAG: DUF2299 domain-containing protein [Candidatus Lokiarchaeota archaeon]